MRLLRIEEDGEFTLVEYVGRDIPRYAILSHTWGADHEEVSFKDLTEGVGKSKKGYRKIKFCGRQASKDGLQYFWVDTCCIDKLSSAELSEAINSMYQWYNRADKCYAYLTDVSTKSSEKAPLPHIKDIDPDIESDWIIPHAWDVAFQQSRWFSRGWTLQELLAPSYVDFFSEEGDFLGDKISLVDSIHSITGIAVQALQGCPLFQFSVDERMSWAETRETKREEDAAYCLLGLFDIHMPLIYGEGEEKAKARLHKKINKALLYGSGMLSSHSLSMESLERANSPFSNAVQGSEMDYEQGSETPRLRTPFTEPFRTIEDYGVVAFSPFGNAETEEDRAKQSKRSSLEAPDRFQGSRIPMRSPSTFSKRLSRYARDSIETNDHRALQLRNRPESRRKPTGNVTDLIREQFQHTQEPLPKSLTREIPEETVPQGHFAHQINMLHMASSTLSDLIKPTKFAPQLFDSANEPHTHIQGVLAQDKLESASAKTAYQILRNLQRASHLQLQNSVNDWLNVTTLEEKFNITQFYDKQTGSRLEGTCEWIFEHPSYQQWVAEDIQERAAKIFWICAPAGHGKTVLCARLVEHLKSLQSNPVAFFFASPHAQSGGDPVAIIRSWVAQITQLDTEILEFVESYLGTGRKASDSEIWSIFGSIAATKAYTFALDGFDEYSRQDDSRADFLQNLKKATHHTKTRVLIASRNETDIEAELSPKVVQDSGHIMLSCKISEKELKHDISLFSRSVVDKKLPNKDDNLRQNLAGQLADKCEGMFLWIKLQQDQLRSTKNAKQLQTIVKNMPVGLTKTYERNWEIIQSHPEEERDRAMAIFRWIIFAFRPLTVSEITEALIVEPEEDGITLQIDELPDVLNDEYVSNEIIDICGALVEVRAEKAEAGTGSKTIHLIHSSVRDFLIPILLQHPLSTSGIFEHTSSQPELHDYLAMICLGYLNDDEVWERYASEETQKYSFLNYAAGHWNSHVNAAKENNKVMGMIKKFFHPKNKNFQYWSRYFESSEEPTDAEVGTRAQAATPLYYAALFNLPSIMEAIWAEEKAQLDSLGGEYGTPLQAACFKGHEKAFKLLLDWGADPDTQGGKFGVAINAAIAGGQKTMAKTLLQKGIDHTIRDFMGRTPLYTAAKNGSHEILQWLIEAGAELEARNKYNWTPLNAAADGGFFEAAKLLVDRKVDVDVCNDSGWSPLNNAANMGFVDVVKLLLDNGAQIETPSSTGWSPLNSAADSGHVEVTKLLIEKGADLTSTNEGEWTPVNSAANNGHHAVLKLLLDSGADYEARNINGWTAINSAANHGHVKAVELLLEKGADFEAKNKFGWTALNVAANSGHLEVVKLLLEKGACVSTANNDGWSPLGSAASDGYLDVVKVLLDHGADVNCTSALNWTPLHAAAKHGHTAVVKLLIEKGADLAAVNSSEWTALNLAANSGHVDVVNLILEQETDVKLTEIANDNGWTPLSAAANAGYLECTRSLLDHGADITTHINKWTALHAAAKHGHIEVMKLLLERGADLAAVNSNGWTVLNAAANAGHTEAVQILIDMGADISGSSNIGWMPLHSASNKGHIEIVKMLLEKGADVNSASETGWTALNSASDSGHLDVVKLLIDEGANIEGLGNDSWTPLHAAADSGHYDVVKLLLEKGAPTSALSVNGWTALNSAASNGHTKVVQLLLDKDGIGSTTVPNQNGWTPLNSAANNGHVDVVKLLLERGPEEIELTTTSDQWTPLNVAANRGHLDVAKVLLERGTDTLSKVNSEGWPPLNSAVNKGHTEIVKLLLDAGADTEISSGTGWKPIHLAANSGAFDIVKMLLEKKASPITTNDAGWTPLLSAANGGYTEIVKLLLENGARAHIEHVSDDGWNAVNLASNGGYLEIVKLLTEAGANVQVPTKGWAALNLAADGAHIEVMRTLLEHGADPTSNVDGWEPLYYAARDGNVEIFKMLIKHGADPTSFSNGWTALDAAGESGQIEIFRLILDACKDVNTLQTLYGSFACLLAVKGNTELLKEVHEKHNADLKLADFHGHTPLLCAARGGFLETFTYAVSLGLDTTCKDTKGDDLLCYAAAGGSAEVLDAVLNIRPASEYQNDGWGPLHWAAKKGNAETIERLLKEGLRGHGVTVAQPEGKWSPLSLAIYHGHQEMLDKLPPESKALLGIEEEDVQLVGKLHGGFWCNSCFCDIYGPRFRCEECPNLDYCFMCKPLLEKLHDKHGWSLVEVPEEEDE